MYVYFFYKPLPKHGAVENQKHGKKKFKVLATRAQKLKLILIEAQKILQNNP
jgi:hypothetical protein